MTDVAFEWRGFTKVHNIGLEGPGRCLDRCAGGDDLDTVHRDLRRDLPQNACPTAGVAGIIRPNLAPPAPARQALSWLMTLPSL